MKAKACSSQALLLGAVALVAVISFAAVPTAPSSCVLALNAPDSTSTPRTLVDTALALATSKSRTGHRVR
jgi:hypothetical protein